MEKERISFDVEQGFKNEIDGRFETWVSLIDGASIANGTKEQLKQILTDFKDKAFTNWDNLEDAIHGTISVMLTITEQEENKREASDLFENIRDDIWDLYKKIK